MRRRLVAGLTGAGGLLAVAVGVAVEVAAPPAAPAGVEPVDPDSATVSGVAGCRVFPRDNYWNTDISRLPVSAHSRQWISHMSPASTLHPDFGPSFGAQPVPYGIPVTVVDGDHRRVRVSFRYAAESDHVRYPLGRDTRIEGGRGARGDRHAVIVDRSRCLLYETYGTRHRHGHWHAGSGAAWDLSSNRLRHQGWTSADAAGLPILPGLLRRDEVEVTGRVAHAIRFTTDVTDRRHIWPARHDAGSVSNHAYPPMGARFRLRAGFSLGGYRPDTVVVLRAMKHYGLVLADNGAPWSFQGVSVRRWPSGLLDELKTIPARAFVAVDTSSLRTRANSAHPCQLGADPAPNRGARVRTCPSAAGSWTR